MYSRKASIINSTGLHARPASDFVKTAGKFASIINIKRVDTGKIANAKSIVFLLSMGLGQGTEVEIFAKGSDEQQAVDTLVDLIESGFPEQTF